jgi:hypothetical protein
MLKAMKSNEPGSHGEKRTSRGMRHWSTALSLIAALLASVRAGGPENATLTRELRNYSTIHSIGIEWEIAEDANHNATCSVQYRARGATDWKPAMPLFRIDWHGWYGDLKADRAYNMLAGSIMFLDPGTAWKPSRYRSQ